MHIVSKFK